MNERALGVFDEAMRRIAGPEAAEQQTRRIQQRQALERQLSETLRTECARGIERIATAIQTPLIARKDLEEALEHLKRAKIAAEALDPEPESA